MLPLAVQFVHSLETHEQLTCNSQNKIHFDAHAIDCSVFHFKINTNTIEFNSAYALNSKSIITSKVYADDDQITSIKLHFISLRGPPLLLI